MFFPIFFDTPQSRLKVENKSRLMEIMQQTRLQFENGDISFEEIDRSIRVSVPDLVLLTLGKTMLAISLTFF